MAAERVSLCDHCIIRWTAQTGTTSDDFDRDFDRIEQIARQLDSISLLLDYAQLDQLTAKQRRHLRNRLLALESKVERVAICTGPDEMLQVGLQFVVAKLPAERCSLHESRDDALATLRGQHEAAAGKAELARAVVERLVALTNDTLSIDHQAIAQHDDPSMRAVLAALALRSARARHGDIG
jgi:hypothetical protein